MNQHEPLATRVSSEVGASSPRQPEWTGFEGDGMTGAEVFANLCKEEGLAALFCAPGNYAITHAIAASGIPSYGGRTEGGMCSAADGFYRASGEVAACSGTEGPGMAHMVMGIAAAHAARTPLLVLASNCTTTHEDREYEIQDLPQQSITQHLRKYGKRIIVPSRIYEYGAHAFRQLKSGIPRPVHLDFTEEVCYARFTDPKQLSDFWSPRLYRTQSAAAPGSEDIRDFVRLVETAKRPVIVAGHGVFHSKGSEPLLKVAERNDLPVVVSGPNRGHFPDDHRLSASLSPAALRKADLVIFIGQYCMPSPREYLFNPLVNTVRVHPMAEDLGRNWPLELGVVSDERLFLEVLLDSLPARTRDGWVGEVQAARKAYEEELDAEYALGLKYSKDGIVHPAVIGKEIFEFFFNGKIDPKQTMTGTGGFTTQRYVPPRLRANRSGQTIASMYQFGALGTAIPMMLGASLAVKNGIGEQSAYQGAPTLVQCGDSEMGYSLLELETAVKYKLPLIVVVYNNNAWGTWTEANDDQNALQLHLFRENTRYDVMAEQLGVHGEYVRSPEEMRAALSRCYDIAARESRPCLINVQAIKEFTSPVTHPPGYIGGSVPEPSIASYQH
ncbi:thiamine pyrophosphate-binding protein [Rhizobium leguminosarum]|nr:thiamine pyrophosphate-binding protein [Rhizobium leguminosarum]MBY5420083.1 thiamine pyrophosphate-binding protein [Rhizobium leguminosarum]MBY5427998.1 thiamine pyrophosphate-binding protein [Rhizobium leguminosarum]MBY5793864.1 thiamine pyrophosphate-binding protein [Rhizobium leguminosarum]